MMTYQIKLGDTVTNIDPLNFGKIKKLLLIERRMKDAAGKQDDVREFDAIQDLIQMATDGVIKPADIDLMVLDFGDLYVARNVIYEAAGFLAKKTPEQPAPA